MLFIYISGTFGHQSKNFLRWTQDNHLKTRKEFLRKSNVKTFLDEENYSKFAKFCAVLIALADVS